MTSSGTYDFSLSNTDVVLEAFDRIGVRPPALTAEHMVSAKRSLNLELQRWSNLGPNLWEIDLITIPLQQGVVTYNIPQETVSLLDVYLRLFSLQTTANVTPNFSTTIGSAVVTIVSASNGLLSGNWINIVTPIAVGGLVLSGFYQVTSALDANTFTITASTAATSTVTSSGVVPLFTSTANQSSVQITLANHGYLVGENFVVAVQTSVSTITLLGAYQVTSIVDASNFVISSFQTASANASASENSGLLQMQTQASSIDPIDTFMTPLGRTDYAMIPDKGVQGRPTSYWFNRQIVPSVTLYQAPDQNGPYELCAYRMKRCQDASPTMGQTPDIPYRFTDALCARMAHRLGMKYAKDVLPMLETEAARAWSEAMIEDRERADIQIMPELSAYYRD